MEFLGSSRSKSKAVTHHPDLGTDEKKGPLTYEVEVYRGAFDSSGVANSALNRKRNPDLAHTGRHCSGSETCARCGGSTCSFGGMTDTYTYMAEGVKDLEYPIPNPEPIAQLLHGLREDDRLDILHTDNGNPSIIAENIEPSTEITKTLVETLGWRSFVLWVGICRSKCPCCQLAQL